MREVNRSNEAGGGERMDLRIGEEQRHVFDAGVGDALLRRIEHRA
jgi:hypothetical protein